MEVSAVFVMLMLHALSALRVRLVALGAAAPQQIPRYGYLSTSQTSHQEERTLQARFYPYVQTLNDSSLPIEPEGQTYILGPSMTINGNLLVPETLTGGNSLPLLLDTLSACTWLPTKSVRCYNSTTIANDSDSKQGDDCHGVSTVALPAINDSTDLNGTSATAGQATQVACGHYLAGAVTGALLRTDLNVAGGVVNDAQVMFADRFYATGNITLHSFAQYYGGAVGVLGLGLYESMWDAEILVQGKKQFSSEIVSGLLRDLWLQQGSDRGNDTANSNLTKISDKVWSMALPRWDNGEEGNGRFVIGGLISNDTVETTGDELMVPLSPHWDDLGLVRKMSYAVDGVSFTTRINSTEAALLEEYFLDSAMPVIYTSQAFATEVASLFSPPGVYDNDTGHFEVGCNATAPSDISFNIDNGRGGKISVPIYPGDLIVPWPLDNKAGGACMSAFQNHPVWPDWRRLGWVFFRNVVLTVDVSQWTANISARMWPEQPSASVPAPPSTSSSTTTSATSNPSTSTSPTSTTTSSHPSISSTPGPNPLSTSTATTWTTKLITTTLNTGVPTTTPPLSTPVPSSSNSASEEAGISVSPLAPSPSPSDTLSISFPKTITAGPSDSAASASDSFVGPPSAGTTASTNGPVGFQRRKEGEARSVADEESGIQGSWVGRRGRVRARARGGKGGRWWPVRLVRRGWWGGGHDEREALEEGKGESREGTEL